MTNDLLALLLPVVVRASALVCRRRQHGKHAVQHARAVLFPFLQLRPRRLMRNPFLVDGASRISTSLRLLDGHQIPQAQLVLQLPVPARRIQPRATFYPLRHHLHRRPLIRRSLGHRPARHLVAPTPQPLIHPDLPHCLLLARRPLPPLLLKLMHPLLRKLSPAVKQASLHNWNQLLRRRERRSQQFRFRLQYFGPQHLAPLVRASVSSRITVNQIRRGLFDSVPHAALVPMSQQFRWRSYLISSHELCSRVDSTFLCSVSSTGGDVGSFLLIHHLRCSLVISGSTLGGFTSPNDSGSIPEAPRRTTTLVSIPAAPRRSLTLPILELILIHHQSILSSFSDVFLHM